MFKKGDQVSSKGRIETIQDESKRFIEFDVATVLEVSGDVITVNPNGMKAIVEAHVSDLTPARLAPSPASQQSAEQTAAAAKPPATRTAPAAPQSIGEPQAELPLTGTVEEEHEHDTEPQGELEMPAEETKPAPERKAATTGKSIAAAKRKRQA